MRACQRNICLKASHVVISGLPRSVTTKTTQRIYANVCLEVFLRSRGTCLLEHINVGQLALLKNCLWRLLAGMTELIELHSKTGVESTGEYLTQEEDRQVGLGMLGLANLLALEGVTYAQFADALDR